LSFNVQALDNASRTFIRMAEHVERLERKLRDLDGTRVRTEVDVDTRRATRGMRDLDRSTANSIIRVAALGRALRTIALPAALLAATPQLISLAAAATESAGALLLIPAAGVAAVTAIGTLVVGLQGFGEAMKQRGDPEKFAEAIANLSPAARAAAVTIRDLGAAWTQMRLDVQEQLFSGLATVIQQLSGTYLPVLADVMGRVATSFNRATVGVSQFLLAAPTVGTFAVGLGQVEAAVGNLSRAALPLTRIFTDLFAAGATFLPGLASGFTGVIERVATFVATARDTEKLSEWIQGGIDTIKQLFELVGNLTGVFRGLFSAASAAGADFLGTLVDVSALMDEFLNSGVGHEALATIFRTINQVVAELKPALIAVGAAIGTGIIALGPALVPLADAFSDIAVAVAPLISDLAELVAVILPPLTAALKEIGPMLGPIAAGLFAIYVQTKLLAATSAVIATLGPALVILRGAWIAFTLSFVAGPGIFAAVGAAMAALPITWVIGALVALVAGVVYAYRHFEGFRNVVDGAFRAIRDAASAVVDWFTGPFVSGMGSAITSVRNSITTGLNAILSVFGTSTSQISAMWSSFWNMLRTVSSAVFNLIRAGIDLMLAAIKALFTGNTEDLKRTWQSFWNQLSSIATAIGNVISGFIGQLWATIRAQFASAISAVSSSWSAFWNGLSSVATNVFGAIRNTVSTVGDAIVGTFRRVVDAVGSVWAGIRALLAKPINFLINTVYMGGIKKAWDTVAGILPGLGPLPSVSPIPEYAKGGPVQRDSIIRAGEAGPEYVLSSPAIKALGGMGAVDQWHQELVASRPRDTLRELNAGRIVEGADHNGPGTSTVGFGGVRPHVAQAGHYLKRKYGIGSVGGVGSRPNASDHPKGLALDFMTSGENGTALANEVIANRAHYAATYAIWRQRINTGSGWRPMANRGSPTANHMDHVHVSFAGPGGVTGAGDTGGGFFDIKAWIREQLEGITNPLIAALRKTFPAPPKMNEIPPAVATSIRDKGLDFLLGKAFDGGGLASGRGLMFKDVMQPERVLSPQQTLAFDRLVGVLDRPPGAPSRDLGVSTTASMTGVEKRLDALIERGTSAPTINVEDRSGNPVETAQTAMYALRMARR
jgi:phage-related protein